MANYTNHKNNKPLTKEILAEIDLRFKRGEAKVHIAKALGISHSVVRKYTAPLPYRIENAVREEALRRLAMGESRRSIAKALGVARQWVSELSPIQGRKPNPVSEEVKEEIVRRVKAGETPTAIARSLGVASDTAYNIVKTRLDLPDDDDIELIKGEIAKGKALREVALMFNHPLYVIKRISGVKSGAYIRYTTEQKMEMAALVSAGHLIRDIKIKFGCTGALIKNAYKDALKNGKVEPKITLGMEDDTELLRVKRFYPQYEQWRIYAVEWYKVLKGNFSVACAAINRFFVYLHDNSLFERPSDFLHKKNSHLIPSFFKTACTQSDHGSAMNNMLVDFLNWLLIQDEFAEISEDGVAYTSPMFGNPLGKELRSDHRHQLGTESNKTVMPYWMIHDLRRRIAQGPNFKDWTWAQTMGSRRLSPEHTRTRDWFVVDPSVVDKSDPDCVTRVRWFTDGTSVLEMWSPVRWIACLIKLQTTARIGQIRMVDSGEADTFIYQNGKFVVNGSPLAEGTLRKPRRQGVLRESSEKLLCLYFNTNKTADISKKGEGKGMECPWPKLNSLADDPYYWIEKLRNWQSKYNPVEGPVAWKDVPTSRRLRGKSESECSTYPDVIFLFRTAEVVGARIYPVPYGTINKLWVLIMTEYETMLALEKKTNPDGTFIKLISNGCSEISIHGLRVSLITHLIMDGGMPPELMMKIVGHARFIMTIYYTKPGLTRIEDALANAAQILDSTKDETLIRDLRSRSAEHIRDHVAFNSKNLTDVIPINPADRNPLGWLPMHDGICLAGGNSGPVSGDQYVPGCHNGGILMDEKGSYGPVPGGVRNCSRCRWKCAGKHHVLGLQATLNNRQYHLHKASATAIDAEKKRDNLLKIKAKTESSDSPFEQMRELRLAERMFESSMQKMQELSLDVAATYRLIERIKDLPDTNSNDATVLLAAQGDMTTLNVLLEETDSELLVLTGICADVEFFPDLDPGTAVFEYADLLNRAFERQGRPLIFTGMSAHEKLIAANALMRQLENFADPSNQLLARRKVVEILDRGNSIEAVLGISLSDLSCAEKLGLKGNQTRKLLKGNKEKK